MRSRTYTASLAALLTAVLLAACGASSKSSSSSGAADNGVAAKSPQAILAAAESAVATLTSVHIAGTAVSSNLPLQLDLTLSGANGEGTIAESGLSFQLRSIGDNIYINASPSFWTHFGGAAAAKLFAGKWLRTTKSGQFASLAALTNKTQLFAQLLEHHGTITKGSKSTVDGHPVIALIDSSGSGGTLYVATTGKPYPIEVANSGKNGGSISFDQFDQPVSIAVPANAVDLSQLK